MHRHATDRIDHEALRRLAVVLLSLAAMVWAVLHRFYRTPEAEMRITTEATAGMLVFALFNVLLMSGRLYAAWKDSNHGR